MKVISGGESTPDYFWLDISILRGSYITKLDSVFTVFKDSSVYASPFPTFVEMPKMDPFDFKIPFGREDHNVYGLEPFVYFYDHSDLSGYEIDGSTNCYCSLKVDKIYDIILYTNNTAADIYQKQEIGEKIEKDFFGNKISFWTWEPMKNHLYVGVNSGKSIVFIFGLGNIYEDYQLTLQMLFDLLVQNGFNVDYSNFRAARQ